MAGASQFDDGMAMVYDRGRSLLPEVERAWCRLLARYVDPGDLVLDVGAGTGRFTSLFAHELDARVVGIDASIPMVVRGVTSGGASVATQLVGAAEHLPVRSRIADAAWLSNVVHHIDLDASGVELARVLHTRGLVFVRQQFPEHFDDVDWLEWFPAAREVDEARMPSVADIERAWAPSGLVLTAREPVMQLVAENLLQLAERLQHRAISTLRLIDDHDFEVGVAAIRRASQVGQPRTIRSRVDLLVFGLG
jgi:ubiquinone/menaquinone biosynthesis C-methylase UbiE